MGYGNEFLLTRGMGEVDGFKGATFLVDDGLPQRERVR